MAGGSLLGRVRRLLGVFVKQRGFCVTAEGDQTDSFGACVQLSSSEFVVHVIRDRGQEWITVGSKIRPKPRAPLRSWPLGSVVAFLDGRSDPYPVLDLATEARWLKQRASEILDSSVINSEELRTWAVRASRRMFGQRAKT
jgi:hypothetical protein